MHNYIFIKSNIIAFVLPLSCKRNLGSIRRRMYAYQVGYTRSADAVVYGLLHEKKNLNISSFFYFRL